MIPDVVVLEKIHETQIFVVVVVVVCNVKICVMFSWWDGDGFYVHGTHIGSSSGTQQNKQTNLDRFLVLKQQEKYNKNKNGVMIQIRTNILDKILHYILCYFTFVVY